jgi:tetratricopeptide (TPR) repeat protein
MGQDAAAAGVMFAALAIGLGVSLWSLRKANREASRSRQVAQFLRDMLQGVEPSVALGRDTAMLREILDRTAQRLDQGLRDQPDVEADLRTTIGRVYLDLGQCAKAEAMYREALALQKKRLGREHPEVARSLSNVGWAVSAQRKFAEAETLFREALAMKRKLFGGEDASIANSLNNLANVLQDQGKLGEAEALRREALAMEKKLLGSQHPRVAETLADLVRTLLLEDKFTEAETPARDCLALHERRRPEGWQTFDARSLLGGALLGQKKYPEAESLLLSGYKGMKQHEADIPAADKRRLKEALQHLVRLCDATGKPEEAAQWKRELAARGL